MSNRKDSRNKEDDIREEDLEEIMWKWLTLPIAITTVLVAGSVLNLIGYFLALKDELGFEPEEQELIRWASAIGYYGGFLAGPFIRVLGNKMSFLISAAISLVGFVILGLYTDSYYVSAISSVTIVILLGLVSFSGCIATIASISTVLKNFPKSITPLLVSMMITYYMVAPYFEKCLRSGFMMGYSFKQLLLISGVIQCATYIMAAFLMKQVNLRVRLQKAWSIADWFGMLIFIIIEGLFVAVIYFSWIIAEKWRAGAFQMIILNVINIFACLFWVWVIKKRIRDTKLDDVAVDIYHPDQDLSTSLRNSHYYILLISTFIVVGTCTAFQLEAPTVAFAMGVPELGFHVVKAFWISDVITRLGGGILAALFSTFVNRYILAALISLVGMLGFSIALLTEPAGSMFFYLSSFLIGGSLGAFWVIAPLIIIQETGTNTFEVLWGMVTSFNVLGVLVFDKTFMIIGGKVEPHEVGTWEGYQCYLTSFIIAAWLCLLAAALWGFAHLKART